MKKFISNFALSAFLLMTFSFQGLAQKQGTANTSIEVLQFHLQHRCYSCNKIEELTKETLKSYQGIPFKLYNVEDKKNEKICAQFEASGSALFLYNPKTGRKKELTSAAFMNVGNEEKFKKELRKEIDEFSKAL
jgi:hypothetical protein